MNDDKRPFVIGIVGTGAKVVHDLAQSVGVDVEPDEIKDQITIQPTLSGQHSKAWLCDLDALRNNTTFGARDTSLAVWLVEAPWAHPVWHSYLISMIHLRPVADTKLSLYLDGATHEVVVYAVNPDFTGREAVITGTVNDEKICLSPPNFAAQFIEIADDLAIDRIRRTVQEICDGQLSPDTDHIGQWADRFGSNMLKGL